MAKIFKIIITFLFIVVIYFSLKYAYFLEYININNTKLVNPIIERHQLKNDSYNSNMKFKYFSFDSKTISKLDFNCEVYNNENGYDNHICKNDEITFLYLSGNDLKIENKEVHIFLDDEAVFYKYKINSSDVSKIFKKHKLDSVIKLNEYFSDKKYIEVNLFSPISEIKEAAAFNWVKQNIAITRDKVHVVSDTNRNFSVYQEGITYIIEGQLNNKIISFAFNSKNINIDQILSLIDSIEIN